MLADNITVELHDIPDNAPIYSTGVTMVTLKRAIVVNKGTFKGEPTIDLQLEDAKGRKFVAVVTDTLIKMISHAVKANNASTEEQH